MKVFICIFTKHGIFPSFPFGRVCSNL